MKAVLTPQNVESDCASRFPVRGLGHAPASSSPERRTTAPTPPRQRHRQMVLISLVAPAVQQLREQVPQRTHLQGRQKGGDPVQPVGASP